MQKDQLNKLRSFENMIEPLVIEDYGTFLTNEKKEYIANNSVIQDNVEYKFTSPENVQGQVIRLIFSELFDKIKCNKIITFSDGEHSVPYGENLKKGLVVYYTNEFAIKHGVNIDSVSANEELELVSKLKEKMQTAFESLAFNCDGLTLLTACDVETVTKSCDSYAVKAYITSLNSTTPTEEKVEEKNDIKDIYPLVYIDGVEHIKYIDNNKEYFIKIKDENEASKIFKEAIKNNNLDVNEIFTKLVNNGESIPFYSKEKKKSKLSSEEKNLLDTFYTTADELLGKEKEVEEKVEVKKESKLLDTSEIKLITEEEYEKLCMKSVNGKSLTDEELLKMEYFDKYYFEGNKPAEKVETPKAPVKHQVVEKEKVEEQTLTLKKAPVASTTPTANAGFAKKFFPVFAIFMTVALGIIAGIIVFKFTH